MAHPSDPRLIRLYCDGELSPEQTSDFEKSLEAAPQDVRIQIEAERKLRGCVGSAIKADCPCAPSELGVRIRFLFAQTSETHEESGDVLGRVGSADQGADAAGRSRQPARFRTTHGANIFAIAATLALIAGAVLFGIFGRQIDDVTPVAGPELAAIAAISASEQHDSVAASRELHAQLRANEARSELKAWLGVPVEVFDLSELGYEFIGADRCEIKLPDRTAHLVYQAMGNATRKPMVSIFIAPYSKRCGGICENMDVSKWVCASKGKSKHNVLYSHDRQLVYFIVCCKEDDLAKLTDRISQMQAMRSR